MFPSVYEHQLRFGIGLGFIAEFIAAADAYGDSGDETSPKTRSAAFLCSGFHRVSPRNSSGPELMAFRFEGPSAVDGVTANDLRFVTVRGASRVASIPVRFNRMATSRV